MGSLTIEDFKAGVDRRRPIFAGVPGSLWEAIDVNLSRGGDAERRKKFVTKYTLPAGTFSLASTDASPYVFGSVADPGVPAGVIYQRLEHPDSTPTMTALLDHELFDGKLYVIAEYNNGDVIHFYDGEVVADWLSGKVRAAMVDRDGIASHLATLIQEDAAYVTTVLGNIITIEAAVAGTPFTISTIAENVTGGNNDQTAVVSLVVANVPAVPEVVSSVSFAITAGTANPGVNAINSITIAGVEVLGAVIDWVTSNNTTAANVATQINTFVSAPEYTATASGQNIIITAAAGTGASPNGFTVVIDPIGDVAVDGAAAAANVTKNLAGGVNAVPGQAQRNTVNIGGTFEIGDRFTVIIDDKRFGADGNPRTVGRSLLTLKNKVLSAVGSIVYFSGVALPMGWNSVEDAGAGFINAATHAAGSSAVTGMESYQGKLAIYARRAVQIWTFDENEELNSISQVLKNTGTRSPKSVKGFSDSDVFALDGYGIRSLRARDSSNAATTAGVGALIDTYVVEYARTLTSTQIESAVAEIEPEDGRFWLALGTKVFVFSYFPETKISGWTWYEPGFQISDFTVFDNRIYARSGNTIYLYGGDDNETYDDAGVGAPIVWVPFLSANKDGTYKSIMGVDIAAVNTWDIDIYVDPNELSRKCVVGTMPGFTYSLDDTPAVAHVTHFSPRLTCNEAGRAVLSKVTVYFEGAEESGRG